jgi:hydroxyacylglutathione hydrolase
LDATDIFRVLKPSTLPLEDELGDVLEKALRRSGLTIDALAARAGIGFGRLRDALDYRSELGCDELRRLAAVLGLNEVGLCALGSGRYPQPEIGALPFCVWPLRMPHGIGVANAYLVGECGATRAILFDTGAGIHALQSVWPANVQQLDAVFLTHVEGEHAGGLCDIVARFGVTEAFIPIGATAPCGRPLGEGESLRFGGIEVSAFTTPGHAAAHNCYLVRMPATRPGGALLISGDLVFAGSVGGAYFSQQQLQSNLRRMLSTVPLDTVIAPGHGPLTTVENELRYNPFVA